MKDSNLCVNEFIDDLLSKIKEDDPTSSQICAFMAGLMQCPWEKIKEVNLTWKTCDALPPIHYAEGHKTIIKPVIGIKFK